MLVVTASSSSSPTDPPTPAIQNETTDAFGGLVVDENPTIKDLPEEGVDRSFDGLLLPPEGILYMILGVAAALVIVKVAMIWHQYREDSMMIDVEEQHLVQSPIVKRSSREGTSREANSCLNCKLIVMGSATTLNDGRCSMCGEEAE